MPCTAIQSVASGKKNLFLAKLVYDAPNIEFLTPTDGSIVESNQVTFSVSYAEGESALDLTTFQLISNGSDVTGQTNITDGGATFDTTLSSGEYTASAAIADITGLSSSRTIDFTVQASVFQAIAECGPTSGSAPLTVSFRSKGEFTEGSIVAYRWDFDGDGSYDTGYDSVATDYSRTFSQSGTFDAVLEVQNNLGELATDICHIDVTDVPPEVITNATPSNGPIQLVVDFSCTSDDANDDITLYEWDFDGDGNYDYSSTTSGGTSYTYDEVGTYAAQCRLTEASGLTAVSDNIDTITSPRPEGSPTVAATASPTTGTAPVTVNFDGAVTGGSTIILYEWDFDGDGVYDATSGTSPEASYNYEAAGLFAATLRVTDDAGLSSQDTIAIDIGANASLSISDDTFQPEYGETAAVQTTLSGTVPVRVLILDDSYNLVRTLVDTTRDAGTYDDYWDGADDDGNLLPDGVYYAVLEYEVAGQTEQIDLTYTTGGSEYNPTRNSFPSSFSPYENDPLDIEFTVPDSQGASEILAFVGLFNTDTRVVTLVNREPFGVGTHTIYWDGLLSDGSFATAPSGDTFLFGIWGYPLPDNAIYLSSAPVISDFSVQPTLFSPARDGSRLLTIQFDLSKDATLELAVENLATGALMFQGEYPGYTAGSNQTLDWDGLNDTGILPDKGEYRLGLTARDSSGSTSLTRYMLIKVFY
ncbi:MAG: PKD repeat-containing protein [Candidatus Kentron sp. G]|nr:MAG: PKD repeat-containing protein [Candidatus Kentron sp. G]VFM99831.1 MAG: PKD repeat-containing protein [Candidatus Kentron sp. G]VFN01675.1 MAG: PKD repeat-containing protein [Candidatus Kentron sp. G]